MPHMITATATAPLTLTFEDRQVRSWRYSACVGGKRYVVRKADQHRISQALSAVWIVTVVHEDNGVLICALCEIKREAPQPHVAPIPPHESSIVRPTGHHRHQSAREQPPRRRPDEKRTAKSQAETKRARGKETPERIWQYMLLLPESFVITFTEEDDKSLKGYLAGSEIAIRPARGWFNPPREEVRVYPVITGRRGIYVLPDKKT